MTGCKNIRNKLTRVHFVLPLSRRLLLFIDVIGGGIGFSFCPGLLLGSFAFAFGFGSPSCRLLVSILPGLLPAFPAFLVVSRLLLMSVLCFLVSSNVLMTWSSPPKIPWEESALY